MKAFLKRMIRKLGSLLVKLGNNLIRIGEHREHLHIQVNSEIKKVYKMLKHDNGKYLEQAFAIVDTVVRSAPVDSNFFGDYYVLKSELERQNTYFAPVLLSVFSSIAVSDVMEFADNTAYPFINEIAGIVLGLLVFAIVCGTHRMMFSKSYNVVYPYLLEKMEEKIKDHQSSAEKLDNIEGC